MIGTTLPLVSPEVVWAILGEIPDPELPFVSIVELGIVGDVAIDPSGAIRVGVLPTYVGCPALALIRAAVAQRLAGFGGPVTIEDVLRPAWTPARISAAGRHALAEAGIAVPDRLSEVRCPWCASTRVMMDSAFGPTRCRSLHWCRDCRQPFEAIKPV